MLDQKVLFNMSSSDDVVVSGIMDASISACDDEAVDGSTITIIYKF